MSRQRPATPNLGPDFYDVHVSMAHLMDRYPVAISLAMEPLLSSQGLWQFRLCCVLKPRTATQHLVNATAKPEAILWEAQWSERHLLSMPSLCFRGLWELEIAITEMLEQLKLPLD